MNKSIKTFACLVLLSAMLLSCQASNSDKISVPIMDSKVVSYKMLGTKLGYPGFLVYGNEFIADQDTLKSWFPHIFNNEQAESRCNYFAIYFTTSSTLVRYWVLSQDMILYQVQVNPGKEGCAENTDIAYHAMLVCDDTAEGNLKDKIDLNSIHSYTDEDWDCGDEEKNVFF